MIIINIIIRPVLPAAASQGLVSNVYRILFSKLLSQLQPGGRGLGELFSFGRYRSGTNSLLTDLKDGSMLVASSISHYFASPCRLEARTEHAWGADPKAVLIELASGAGSVPLTLNSCLNPVSHVALSFLLHKSCLSYKVKEVFHGAWEKTFLLPSTLK